MASSKEFAALIKPLISKIQYFKFWVPGKRYQHMSDSCPGHEQVRMCLTKGLSFMKALDKGEGEARENPNPQY